MKDYSPKPVLVELLAQIIQADVARTIDGMPHLSAAERKIALGRAIRKGLVDDLVRDLITEEIHLAQAGEAELTDELADAFLHTASTKLEA